MTLDGLHGGPMAQDPFVAGLLAALRGRGLADADMAKRLQVALQTFDEASIFTIHGFCQRALSDTPFAAALPMSTELLADDGELQLQVVNDFWRRRLAGDALDPALAALLVAAWRHPRALGRVAEAPGRQALVADDLARGRAAGGRWRGADAGALPQVQALWAAGRQAIVARVREALPRLNAAQLPRRPLATAHKAGTGCWPRPMQGRPTAGSTSSTC
jgi:exodeoxyribonuclease V beta subunit